MYLPHDEEPNHFQKPRQHRKRTMPETLGNIGFVHPDCASKANPELLAGKPLESFIGKFVKTAFSGKDPRSGIARLEHMWVEVKSVRDGKFSGLLNNDPVLDYDYPLADGTEVTVDPATVEDILD